MESGYEALPPRATGRSAKRRRQAEPGEEEGAAAAASSAAAAVAASDEALRLAPYTPRCGEEQWEYLDHTADVQIHSWGDTLGDALLYAAVGMFNYKTDLQGIRIDHPAATRVVTAEGHDLVSLFFNFMDACLYMFASEYVVAKDFRLVSLVAPGVEDGATDAGSSSAVAASSGAGGPPKFSIKAIAYGEKFIVGHHQQGTEVKAITYSNMQIFTPSGRTYTAGEGTGIDVGGEGGAADAGAGGGSPTESSTASPAAAPTLTAGGGDASLDPLRPDGRRRGVFDAYIIVDI